MCMWGLVRGGGEDLLNMKGDLCVGEARTY